MIFELEGADRVGDPFDRIFQAVRPVVHRVDFPGAAGPVMLGVHDPVHDRVAHIEVGRGHVDLRPERLRAVGKLAGLHPGEEVEVFLDRAVAPGAGSSRLGRGAARGAHLFGGHIADVGFPLFDQIDRVIVHLLEVVARETEPVLPVGAEPADVGQDRLDIFGLLLRGIGVVEAEVEQAVVFGRHGVVQADRLRMPDVEIAVRFRGEPGVNATAELPGFFVVGDDLFNEMKLFFARRAVFFFLFEPVTLLRLCHCSPLNFL